MLLEAGHDDEDHAGGCLYRAVDDLDQAHARLADAGVVFTREPHLIFADAGGTFGPAGEEEWMAFFRDSEGNTLALAWRGPARGDGSGE